MASFPKLLSRPRLQLLVLMLFLVTGLFPEKTCADEELTTANPAGAPAGRADANAAEGRADKSVKCYEENSNSTDTTCLKPDFDKMGTISCESGYCFSNAIEFEDGSARVARGCAPSRKWGECMNGKPEGCLIGDADVGKYFEALYAVDQCATGKPHAGYTPDKKKIKKEAICMCGTEKCNTGTSSGRLG